MKKLLLPVDFTKVTKEILSYAKTWIQNEEYEPTLIYISEAFSLEDGHEFGELAAQVHTHPLKEKIKKIALDKMKALGEEYFPGKKVKTEVFFGDPGEAISTYINENKFDMTILGHHNKSGIENFLIGSVAEKVTRLSEMPVLCFNEDRTTKGKPNEIMAMVDFGINTEAIWKRTLEIAKTYNGKVTLCTIIDPHAETVIELSKTETFSTYNELLEKSQKEVTNKLEDLKKKFIDENIECELAVQLTTDYKTPEFLLRFTKEANPDLVVMGTHGHGAIKKFLFGSTAEYFIRRFQGNLLIMK